VLGFAGQYDDDGMLRNILKFGVGGLVLAAVAVGVLFLADYIRYRSSPEYRAEQYLKDLERRYREDPYGGSTPEETLQLFIDALKKGDIELASKYFSIEHQEVQKQELIKAKDEGILENIIFEGQKLKLSKKDNELAFFTISNERGVVEVQVVIGRSSATGKWKILEL